MNKTFIERKSKIGFKWIRTGIVYFFKIVKAIIVFIYRVCKCLIRYFLFLIDQLLEILADKLQLKIYQDNLLMKKILTGIVVATIGIGCIVGGTFTYMNHKNNSLEISLMEANELINKDGSIKSKSEIDMSKVSMFGESVIKARYGKVDAGRYDTDIIRYKTASGNVKTKEVKVYGVGNFTESTKSRYVKDFTDYVQKTDKDFYNKYFGKVHGPGTTTFTTGWQDAATEEEEKFLKMQFDYIYLAYVYPVMKNVQEQYGIDITNKAMKELMFSMSTEYGLKGTLKIFKEAGIEKDMPIKEIIEKVSNERIKSLGVYTYTDEWKYTDDDRKDIEKIIKKEKKALLKML